MCSLASSDFWASLYKKLFWGYQKQDVAEAIRNTENCVG
jgi:hypothetical protein